MAEENTKDLSRNQESEDQNYQVTQIGIHSIRNMLGNQGQISLFSDRRPGIKEEGLNLDGIERFGFDLTEIQFRIMEGVLRGFSETGYRGNLAPMETEDVIQEKPHPIPSAYKYITEVPRLRATQKQILEWSGMNKNSAGDVERGVDALNHFAKTPYCFYYDRLAYNSKGIPEKDMRGKWKKEEVIAVDTLFSVKEIRDKQSGILKYYEIMPSSIFLDQRENYFMMIPYNWREEVQKIAGKKRVSSYTFKFLYFLRYQYEMKRRNATRKKPYEIRWSAEEIAIALKMPESVYRGQKKRASQILEESYAIAKKLGYLTDYKRDDAVDILFLKDEKYFGAKTEDGSNNQESSEKVNDKSSLSAEGILVFFYKELAKLDPKQKEPEGKNRQSDLKEFALLLKERLPSEIEEVVLWGLEKKYWCTKLLSPIKLRKNFQDALIEMRASAKSSPKNLEEINRTLAKKLQETCQCDNPKMKIELLHDYLEINDSGLSPFMLNYQEKDFRKKLEHALKKRQISALLD
ncbi:MAG: hypothetical protein K1000chlam3_00372 [Chlamydiae bacterium]|nr:hypothetical protein [Chlamydiota bacterium]